MSSIEGLTTMKNYLYERWDSIRSELLTIL